MNIQAVKQNRQVDYTHSYCFGNFGGRVVRAINNAASSFAGFFGFAQKVAVLPLPKKIIPTSFSYLAQDVTKLIAAKLPDADLQNFRLVETFTNRCVTNFVVNQRLATLDRFIELLKGHLQISEDEKALLVLKPDFREGVLHSTLKTCPEILHRMKFVLVGLLVKHLSMSSLGRINHICWDTNIGIPHLRGNKRMYFNKNVIETAKDFMKMYCVSDKAHNRYSTLDYWLNEGFIESNRAYFFEIDLIIAKLEKKVSQGKLRDGMSGVFRNLFRYAHKYTNDTQVFVQKIEKFMEIIGNIPNELLKTQYLKSVLRFLHYSEPNSILLNAFSKGITPIIESLTDEETKQALALELKLFLYHPEDPHQCGDKLTTHRIVMTFQ